MLKPPKGCAPTMAPVLLRFEVEVTYLEGAAGVVEFTAVRGVDRAGETVLRVIRDVESFFIVLDANDGEHGAEDLFLRDARCGCDVCNEVGWM